MTSTPNSPGTPSNPAAPATRPGLVASSDVKLTEDAKKTMMRAKMVSASLGAVVSILMRSPEHKQHSLADLEWLIGPAIARQQFAIVEAPQGPNNMIVPVAAALWAMVSPGVDQRLTSELERPIRLTPAEWTSGQIPWIIIAAGDGPALSSLLQKVTESKFVSIPPKIRVRGRDGRIAIGRIELKPQAAAPVTT